MWRSGSPSFAVRVCCHILKVVFDLGFRGLEEVNGALDSDLILRDSTSDRTFNSSIFKAIIVRLIKYRRLEKFSEVGNPYRTIVGVGGY